MPNPIQFLPSSDSVLLQYQLSDKAIEKNEQLTKKLLRAGMAGDAQALHKKVQQQNVRNHLNQMKQLQLDAVADWNRVQDAQMKFDSRADFHDNGNTLRNEVKNINDNGVNFEQYCQGVLIELNQTIKKQPESERTKKLKAALEDETLASDSEKEAQKAIIELIKKNKPITDPELKKVALSLIQAYELKLLVEKYNADKGSEAATKNEIDKIVGGLKESDYEEDNTENDIQFSELLKKKDQWTPAASDPIKSDTTIYNQDSAKVAIQYQQALAMQKGFHQRVTHEVGVIKGSFNSHPFQPKFKKEFENEIIKPLQELADAKGNKDFHAMVNAMQAIEIKIAGGGGAPSADQFLKNIYAEYSKKTGNWKSLKAPTNEQFQADPKVRDKFYKVMSWYLDNNKAKLVEKFKTLHLKTDDNKVLGNYKEALLQQAHWLAKETNRFLDGKVVKPDFDIDENFKRPGEFFDEAEALFDTTDPTVKSFDQALIEQSREALESDPAVWLKAAEDFNGKADDDDKRTYLFDKVYKKTFKKHLTKSSQALEKEVEKHHQNIFDQYLNQVEEKAAERTVFAQNMQTKYGKDFGYDNVERLFSIIANNEAKYLRGYPAPSEEVDIIKDSLNDIIIDKGCGTVILASDPNSKDWDATEQQRSKTVRASLEKAAQLGNKARFTNLYLVELLPNVLTLNSKGELCKLGYGGFKQPIDASKEYTELQTLADDEFKKVFQRQIKKVKDLSFLGIKPSDVEVLDKLVIALEASEDDIEENVRQYLEDKRDSVEGNRDVTEKDELLKWAAGNLCDPNVDTSTFNDEAKKGIVKGLKAHIKAEREQLVKKYLSDSDKDLNENFNNAIDYLKEVVKIKENIPAPTDDEIYNFVENKSKIKIGDRRHVTEQEKKKIRQFADELIRKDISLLNNKASVMIYEADDKDDVKKQLAQEALLQTYPEDMQKPFDAHLLFAEEEKFENFRNLDKDLFEPIIGHLQEGYQDKQQMSNLLYNPDTISDAQIHNLSNHGLELPDFSHITDKSTKAKFENESTQFLKQQIMGYWQSDNFKQFEEKLTEEKFDGIQFEIRGASVEDKKKNRKTLLNELSHMRDQQLSRVQSVIEIPLQQRRAANLMYDASSNFYTEEERSFLTTQSTSVSNAKAIDMPMTLPNYAEFTKHSESDKINNTSTFTRTTKADGKSYATLDLKPRGEMTVKGFFSKKTILEDLDAYIEKIVRDIQNYIQRGGVQNKELKISIGNGGPRQIELATIVLATVERYPGYRLDGFEYFQRNKEVYSMTQSKIKQLETKTFESVTEKRANETPEQKEERKAFEQMQHSMGSGRP